MVQFYAVVMAGGQGTRFWPESVRAKPKQYLALAAEKSLLRQSLERFGDIIPATQRLVVTVKEQQQLAREHAKSAAQEIVLEPAGRNTAPCILLALAKLLASGATKEDVAVIVPADHVILNVSAFQETIKKSCLVASQEEAIITIGIPPYFPHTGYGYIEREQLLQEDFYRVRSFKEKPDFATAQNYVASGKYLWNAGMFVARIGFLLDEFTRYAPAMAAYFESLQQSLADPEKLQTVYQQLDCESIDYAIMEKSAAVLVTPASFDWNDLGSWDALENVLTSTDKNVLVNAKHFYAIDAQNNIVFTPGKLATLVGVNDLIIVANERSVLVMPKKDAQRVKEVVTHLQQSSWGEEYL